MEFQEIKALLGNTKNEPSKVRTKNWVEISYESRGRYKASNQIKSKTSMIRLNWYDYSNAYILVRKTITIKGEWENDAVKRENERNKVVIFKNFALFNECISNLNNTQIDNAKNIHVLMPVCILIE